MVGRNLDLDLGLDIRFDLDLQLDFDRYHGYKRTSHEPNRVKKEPKRVVQVQKPRRVEHKPQKVIHKPKGVKHASFYFPDGNLVILVEATLYNVYRHVLMRESELFSKLLSPREGIQCDKRFADHKPLRWDSVTCKDFDLLLSILYPPDVRTFADLGTTDWFSVFTIASDWSFNAIRDLAITELTILTSPLQKVWYSRKYDIPGWEFDSYKILCTQSEPLTEEEGECLGLKEVIIIGGIRETYLRQRRSIYREDNLDRAIKQKLCDRRSSKAGRLQKRARLSDDSDKDDGDEEGEEEGEGEGEGED